MSAKSLTFYSPSGGAGQSSVAINMAAILSHSYPEKKLLLLDADLLLGAVSLRLFRSDEPSLYDLIEALRADEKDLSQFFRSFENPSFDVLACPEPNEVPRITVEDAKLLMKYVFGQYDVVLIDTGHDFLLPVQQVFLSSVDKVLLTTTTEVDRLYNASRAKHYLSSFVGEEKLGLLFSAYDFEHGIDIESAVRDLFQNMTPFFLLPEIKRSSEEIAKSPFFGTDGAYLEEMTRIAAWTLR